MVKLVPCGGAGEPIRVERRVAEMSSLIKSMIADDDDGDDECDVPLPNVDAATLARVVAFLQHHVDAPMRPIPKPLKTPTLRDVVEDAWDADLVALPKKDVIDLASAANYLHIESLLDLACAQIATHILNKSPEEIRKEFGIVGDFTAAEEKEIREQNKWLDSDDE